MKLILSQVIFLLMGIFNSARRDIGVTTADTSQYVDFARIASIDTENHPLLSHQNATNSQLHTDD